MLKIFIPTLNRVDRQGTWGRIPKKYKNHTLLVCPPEEMNDHAQRGRRVVGCPAKGIAPTRDWIMQYAVENGYRRILMLDDDLAFQYHDGEKIKDSTEAQAVQALEWMEDSLGRHAHAAFAPRFLNYEARGDQPNMRAMYALGYNVRKFVEAGAQFTFLGEKTTMEDFYSTLWLMTHGHANVVSGTFRVNPGQSNVNGGCSTWRTTAAQTASAKRLNELFPDFVKLREKKEWQGMEAGMLDVTIYWKKAAKAGGAA
jgi:hypothetical protein